MSAAAKIACFVFGHQFVGWRRAVGSTSMTRRCKRCGRIELRTARPLKLRRPANDADTIQKVTNG